MHRNTVNYYFKKIVEALEECEVKLQRNPSLKSRGKRIGVEGWYHAGTIVIKDTKYINFALVLIHEALHHIYPNWPERGCEGEPIELFARSLLCEFSTEQISIILSFVPR